MLKSNFERSPHLLEAHSSTCYATRDRILRCDSCRLCWDISDPEPPPACRARQVYAPNRASAERAFTGDT
jgi:hypothetical protein